VHQPVSVRCAERGRDLLTDGRDHGGLERVLALEHLAQARAVDVLHDQENQLPVLAGVVDAYGVGVAELRRRARLALEALDHGGVRCMVGVEELDGHRP